MRDAEHKNCLFVVQRAVQRAEYWRGGEFLVNLVGDMC
ncbi:hypothetical protein VCLMA_A0697 [Vibrio cholerae LMA3984-4]|nr:hypothetical protein VCLMA_A0697 [Vibrio cholerae LMA3984-4]